MDTYHIYVARISPTPNRNTVLQRLEGSNAIEYATEYCSISTRDCHILLVVRYETMHLLIANHLLLWLQTFAIYRQPQ